MLFELTYIYYRPSGVYMDMTVLLLIIGALASVVIFIIYWREMNADIDDLVRRIRDDRQPSRREQR
jgi:Na+/proline symporter